MTRRQGEGRHGAQEMSNDKFQMTNEKIRVNPRYYPRQSVVSAEQKRRQAWF